MDNNSTPENNAKPLLQSAPPQREAPDPTPPSAPPTSPPPERRKESWRNVVSTLLVLLIAPLIAVFLTAFVFQSYEVSGPSMQTTLNNNDRLIVWKLPRTWARVTGHPYVPKRSDVVVFVGRSAIENQKQLIKRVVALPGEKVIIKNETLIVYNKQHPQGFQPDTSLPYGKVITATLPETDQTEWTVGQGEVFVCGDNRSNSLDSRTFGPISTNDIVGKLAIRVLPLNQAKRF